MTGNPIYNPGEWARRKALIESGNECGRSGKVAWSLSLEAQIQLQPKCGRPQLRELVCGECRRKDDPKPEKLSKRAKGRDRDERKRGTLT